MRKGVDRFLTVAEGAISAAGAVLPLVAGDSKIDLQRAQTYALKGVRLLRKLLEAVGEDRALELLERVAGVDATTAITDEELEAQTARVLEALTGEG